MGNQKGSLFPDEIILQILAGLPVQSHCSGSIAFRQILHFLVQSRKISVICVDNLSGVSELSLAFIRDRVRVRTSCNGVLCCSSGS
ncbi:hypothetical protein Bca4012_014133 [Brassica carinata]|uniref:Uncharacterized protein n=1 Tax=Brassica carinata TaxID=52824 RepID=A0A8X7U078_BRACI|nr:hypothetical protein Bca52824_095701 [Brassica carinata]KAG2261107.1 hypothetical protein Bca52824_068186 [Brassica carinata]